VREVSDATRAEWLDFALKVQAAAAERAPSGIGRLSRRFFEHALCLRLTLDAGHLGERRSKERDGHVTGLWAVDVEVVIEVERLRLVVELPVPRVLQGVPRALDRLALWI
jgi:hypothetical protein